MLLGKLHIAQINNAGSVALPAAPWPWPFRDELQRETALITFLVTLSGVAIAGVGSAFWRVVAGRVALFVQQYGQEDRAPLSGPAKTTTTSRSLKNP